MSNVVYLNDFEVAIRNCSPLCFDGVLSNRELAGLEVNFSNLRNEDYENIKVKLFTNDLKVKDPFSNREYQATIIERQSSFTVGSDLKSVRYEIKEIDAGPDFEQIELDSLIFDLIVYSEYIFDSNKVGRECLLKIPYDKFDSFKELLVNDSLKVRRIGVDDEPLILRFGSQFFWSEHSENDEIFYKQIVRLFDCDLQPSKNTVSSTVIQGNAYRMIADLTSRLDSLIKVLACDHVGFSEDVKSDLTNLSLNKSRDDIFIDLHKVKDAEDIF